MNRSPILYLVPDLCGPPGGIARHSRHVACALQRDGVAVLVVALHDQPDQTGRCADLGGSYYPCAGNRARFVGTALRQLLLRPSLVLVGHVHLLPPVLIPARALGIPVAVFLHGVEVWDRLPGLRGWSLRQADRVIAVSDYSARRASAKNGILSHRVRVLPSSLGPEPHSAGPRAPNEARTPRLLSVGRLSRDEGYKGHREVIAALPFLSRQYPDLVYDIVGDGDDRPALEALVREQGLEERVRFHGRISDEELERLYTRATIFVLPSSGEGFGFVFLDAMAHGVPVVAGNRDATPEVVSDGETGILVDPGDPQALTGALQTLLGDTALRERMGRAGIARVQERFSFLAFRRRLLRCLGELSPQLLQSAEAP